MVSAVDLWEMERGFWLGGAEHYRRHMSEDAMMVFGPVGVLKGEEIVATIEDAPRWSEVTFKDSGEVDRGETRVLVYLAEAHRADSPPYSAYCTSTYIRDAGSWKLIAHQQTPTSD